MLLVGVLFFGFFIPNVALGVGLQILLPGGILLVHALLVTAFYFFWFWRRDGRTLAMKTWKIQLQSINGEAPSIDQLLLRLMLAGPAILCFGVGLIWAIFDRDRQFLHDRLSGTRLVFTAPPSA